MGAGVFLLIVLILAGSALRRPAKEPSRAWNQEAIKGTYVASQLRELDKTHSSLLLSYDLTNFTDLDYRLAEGPGLAIVSRLKADGSLSQEEPIHLSYPVFLPARQRARIAIEIARPFSWPVRDDPSYDDKLRDFVRQRLAAVGEFVLFDESSLCQIELPGAWRELQDKAQASN